MKKFVLGLLGILIFSNAHATILVIRDASSLSRGQLPNERLDNSSVTKQGPIDLSNINAINSLVAVADSTSTLTFFGGGVLLSTANPISGQTFRITKDTWLVAGFDAFINKASSVGASNFQLFHSSSNNYGVTWVPIGPQIVVTTNTRYSTYYSTPMSFNDGEWLGVGVATVPISGLPPEDWGFNVHVLRNRKGQVW